jgi:hypothetical protein
VDEYVNPEMKKKYLPDNNNKKFGLTMKAGQDLCHNIACHQHMDMWNLENNKIQDFVP